MGAPLSPSPPEAHPLQLWIQLPRIHSTDSFSINVLKMKILIKKNKNKKLKNKPARIPGGWYGRVCTGRTPSPGPPPLSPTEAGGNPQPGGNGL